MDRLRSSGCPVLLASLLVFLSLPSAHGQDSRKIPIVVRHTGDDTVGQAIAFELREGIRGAQAMKLVAEDYSSPRIRVSIVSFDIDSTKPEAYRSAFAVSVGYDANDLPLAGYHITLSAHSCGRNVVQNCGRSILAKIDREIELLRNDWPRLYSALR